MPCEFSLCSFAILLVCAWRFLTQLELNQQQLLVEYADTLFLEVEGCVDASYLMKYSVKLNNISQSQRAACAQCFWCTAQLLKVVSLSCDAFLPSACEVAHRGIELSGRNGSKDGFDPLLDLLESAENLTTHVALDPVKKPIVRGG